MRLIDEPFVAALDQRGLRKRCGCAGRCNEDGVGILRGDLEDLAEHAGVGALIALGGHNLDAGAFEQSGHHLDPPLSIGVAEADQADALDGLALHMVQDDGRHLRIALRCLEHPAALVGRRIDDQRRTGKANHWRLALGDDIQQRK